MLGSERLRLPGRPARARHGTRRAHAVLRGDRGHVHASCREHREGGQAESYWGPALSDDLGE